MCWLERKRERERGLGYVPRNFEVCSISMGGGCDGVGGAIYVIEISQC